MATILLVASIFLSVHGQTYYLSPPSHYCPDGQDVTSAADCEAAAIELGFPDGYGYKGVGNWPNSHHYCTWNGNGVDYNEAQDTGNPVSDYPPTAWLHSICLAPEPNATGVVPEYVSCDGLADGVYGFQTGGNAFDARCRDGYMMVWSYLHHDIASDWAAFWASTTTAAAPETGIMGVGPATQYQEDGGQSSAGTAYDWVAPGGATVDLILECSNTASYVKQIRYESLDASPLLSPSSDVEYCKEQPTADCDYVGVNPFGTPTFCNVDTGCTGYTYMVRRHNEGNSYPYRWGIGEGSWAPRFGIDSGDSEVRCGDTTSYSTYEYFAAWVKPTAPLPNELYVVPTPPPTDSPTNSPTEEPLTCADLKTGDGFCAQCASVALLENACPDECSACATVDAATCDASASTPVINLDVSCPEPVCPTPECPTAECNCAARR